MQIDDLQTGDFVTVFRWEPRKVFTHTIQGVEVHEQEESSYVGDPLKVIAVDLPFIAAKILNRSGHRTIRLDTRKVDLREVSSEYVEALKKEEES